jgi:serine/threonine-protein kinase RsbW
MIGIHGSVATDFTLDDLARIRASVSAAAVRAGLGADVDGLVLAVNELVTNAIRYAGGRGRLRIEYTSAGLDVEVADDGPGLAAAGPDAAPALTAEGGRGLWLVRQICADIRIATGPAGTTVRLRMRRSA